MVLFSKQKALNMPRKTKFVGKTDIEIVNVVDKNVELNRKIFQFKNYKIMVDKCGEVCQYIKGFFSKNSKVLIFIRPALTNSR